jgi:hypothetical protein
MRMAYFRWYPVVKQNSFSITCFACRSAC